MIEFSAEIPKVLYPIGSQPMLFRAINSLKCEAFGKAYVFNKSGEMASELIGHLVGTDRQSFPIKVVSKKTEANHWPQALKSLDPKKTFLLQLCDALLWLGLEEDASESQLRENWLSLVRRHRDERRRNPAKYLGTLIVSDDYMIPAGVVKYSGIYNEVDDDGTTENPSPCDLRLHINTGNALLEPGILQYVDERHVSMLGDAIKAAIRDGKIFTALNWTKWYHVLSQESWKVTHQKFENKNGGGSGSTSGMSEIRTSCTTTRRGGRGTGRSGS